MSIAVRGVRKKYGPFLALDDVSLLAPTGGLMALLGPSGSGKTSLLRIIAGLEVPDAGSVLVRDDDVTGRSARERNVGFVFQHYALFRHMTVFENIAFGLRVRHRPLSEIRNRVGELLHLIRLDGLGDRYPSQLSGGQRQRVALARALAPEPAILLLDEPFGALDRNVRQELRQALRRLHDTMHVTSILVTHDQEEAFDVADEVVIMNAGKIEQAGSPAMLFERPATPFVMEFLGGVNKLPGDGVDPVFARAHDLEIDRTAIGPLSLLARVDRINPAGALVKVSLTVEQFGIGLFVELPPARHTELALQPGEQVYVFPRKYQTFAGDYTI